MVVYVAPRAVRLIGLIRRSDDYDLYCNGYDSHKVAVVN